MNQVQRKSSKFTLLIIWSALLFSMLLYLVITINYVKNPEEELNNEVVFQFLSGISIVLTFVSQFFYRKALRKYHLEKSLKQAFPMLIVTWALGEAIAVFGVVLGFYGIEPFKVYSFFAAAIFLHLVRHPFRFQDQ